MGYSMMSRKYRWKVIGDWRGLTALLGLYKIGYSIDIWMGGSLVWFDTW